MQSMSDEKNERWGDIVEETADAIGVSPRTIKRRWHLARAFLFERLHGAAR